MIRYIKELGITSIQLMPVASFMSEPRLIDLGLVNYWGYNPICFMAPDPRYGVKDAGGVQDNGASELHKAGSSDPGCGL